MDIIKLSGQYGACNTYVLRSGDMCAVIDPSAPVEDIIREIKNTEIKYILLTHGHFDHFLTLDELADRYPAPICIHYADADFLKDPYLNGSELLTSVSITAHSADRTLSSGGVLHLGNELIKVIATPGHTEGSVCFECGNVLISGDTLFDCGYGRYDLPSGDPRKLAHSLRMLADRSDDPMIYPGHGASCALSCADYIIYLRKNL